MELKCVICGYELHGLPHDGSCPECGTPVEKSRLGDRLAAAEPNWLRTIVWGQRLLSIGPFVSLGALLLALVATLGPHVVGLVTQGRIVFSGDRVADVIRVWGTAAGLVPITVGAFLLTTQEPRDSFEERWLSARRLARWGMLTFMLAFGLPAAAEAIFGTNAIVSAFIDFFTAIALTVAVAAALYWLATLAQRIPRSDLEGKAMRSARFIRWSVPVVGAFDVFSTLARQLKATATGGVRDALADLAGVLVGLYGCFAGILVLVLLVQLLGLIGLMAAFSSAFVECWQTARAMGVDAGRRS